MRYIIYIAATRNSWEVTKEQFDVWLKLNEDNLGQTEFTCYVEEGDLSD